MKNKNKLILVKLFAFIVSSVIALSILVYFPEYPPFIRPVLMKLQVEIPNDSKMDPRFLKWFNRDPERVVPTQKNIIVSPADGVVELILSKGSSYHVVIEMRYTDVHVQRVPLTGRVIQITGGGEEFQEGFNILDYELDKMMPFQKITTMETVIGEIKIRQITSFFAKRIEVYLKVGDEYSIGERLGRVLAGSTVVLEVPGKVEILVNKHDIVTAGESIIGTYRSSIQ